MNQQGELTASYGWERDIPDHRDLHSEHGDIKKLLGDIGAKRVGGTTKIREMPPKVDLRQWASPVVEQGKLQSCTAHATVAVMEYMQRRVYGSTEDLSRLFIYKNSRFILQWPGDSGAHLRAAVGSLRLIGAPPERFWPYDVAKFDDEPPPFCFAIAQSYKLGKHFRLDTSKDSPAETLHAIKDLAARSIPTVFGYTVYGYANMVAGTNGGKILWPTKTDIKVGGHAMAVFGYDDTMQIANDSTGGITTKGALLCKNSRGPDWGDKGYAWLPYEYVLQGIAVDCWAMISTDWVDMGQFEK